MWKDEPEWYRGKWYAVQGYGVNKTRKSLRTTDHDLARRCIVDLNAKSRNQEVVFEEMFNFYKEEKENKYDRLEYVGRVILPYFGHLRDDQITRQVCRDYHKDRNVADGTIIRDLGVVRSACYFFDKNSQAQFWFPPKPAPKDRYLTRNEVNKLISGCAEPHVQLYIILAIGTAARKSALLELQWSQVDFKNDVINLGVGHGNKKRAIVPMNITVRNALYAALQARETDYVIEFRGRGIKDIKAGIKRTAARAGIENVSPHVLRHTAAVWMAEDQVPMSEISQYLGHTSTAVTETVYARYSPGYLRKAANSLELGAIAPLRSTL